MVVGRRGGGGAGFQVEVIGAENQIAGPPAQDRGKHQGRRLREGGPSKYRQKGGPPHWATITRGHCPNAVSFSRGTVQIFCSAASFAISHRREQTRFKAHVQHLAQAPASAQANRPRNQHEAAVSLQALPTKHRCVVPPWGNLPQAMGGIGLSGWVAQNQTHFRLALWQSGLPAGKNRSWLELSPSVSPHPARYLGILEDIRKASSTLSIFYDARCVTCF